MNPLIIFLLAALAMSHGPADAPWHSMNVDQALSRQLAEAVRACEQSKGQAAPLVGVDSESLRMWVDHMDADWKQAREAGESAKIDGLTCSSGSEAVSLAVWARPGVLRYRMRYEPMVHSIEIQK